MHKDWSSEDQLSGSHVGSDFDKKWDVLATKTELTVPLLTRRMSAGTLRGHLIKLQSPLICSVLLKRFYQKAEVKHDTDI